jgi:hypothetical protein
MDGLKLNGRKRTPWVCVGFEADFGPKGHGNIAQALAWVWSLAIFLSRDDRRRDFFL